MLVGCKSVDSPNPPSSASVTIEGRTLIEVREAIAQVFRESGYQLARLEPFGMIYERRGGFMSNLAYGGWEWDTVWTRVKLQIDPLRDTGYAVRAQAFRVSDHGDRHFESEKQASRSKNAQCQKLLDAVQARLKS
jgi:hypothetical protein